MAKMKLSVFLAGGLMCINGLCADAVGEIAESTAVAFVEAAYTEHHFRKAMATNSEFAVKAFFSEDAANKWRALKEANFSDEQIRDFFVGVVQLRGPVSEKGSIAGFYNPWWDAIFVAENYGGAVVVDGAVVTVRKVTDFAFLSGERFRGEQIAEIPSAESVLSKEHLLPMTLAALTAKTRQKFDSTYPSTSDMPLLAEHPESDEAANLKAIQTRSALRLKMAHDFIGNAKDYKEAWQLAKIMQDGKKPVFDLIFSSDHAKMMSSYFVKLPPSVRRGFEPYAWYRASDGSNVRLYAYVNRNHPRLFALAYLGTGHKKTVFQWFDFARADEIVNAFKIAEEVRK